MRKNWKTFFRRFATIWKNAQEPTRSYDGDGSRLSGINPAILQSQSNASSPNHQRFHSEDNGQASHVQGPYHYDPDPEPIERDPIEIQEEVRSDEKEINIAHGLARDRSQEDNARLQSGSEDILGQDRLSCRSEDEESEVKSPGPRTQAGLFGR